MQRLINMVACPLCGRPEDNPPDQNCDLCRGKGLITKSVNQRYIEACNPENFCEPHRDFENLPSYQRGNRENYDRAYRGGF